MLSNQKSHEDKQGPVSEGFFVSSPTISAPKGGGAIRSMGEKFAANPVNGTGSMTVPITTSPGRSGFGPQLSLSYDSGSGNGPFGFGWSLSLPCITRKTDKGLPRYDDVNESDVFILSGVEDLVPVLGSDNKPLSIPNRTINENGIAKTYKIKRYRPRIEGLFARIERWTRIDDPGDVHWRSISKDNILTFYGKDENSRIVDPTDSSCIFSWLICETRDDKGNAVIYTYKAEDGTGIDISQANERNRGALDDPRRKTNRYLKRILYGNVSSLLNNDGHRPPFLTKDKLDKAGWMFEVVLDYGEHDAVVPTPSDSGDWNYRNDPFSIYRAGFEVRTTRRCQRVLMFHHFDGEEGVGKDCLVRSTDFNYSYEQVPRDARSPVYSFLSTVTQTGYKRNAASGYLAKSLPPVVFEYSPVTVQESVEEIDSVSLANLPIGVDGSHYQWTDLHGEGIPGILTEQAGVWFYKRNISPVGTRPVEFAPLEMVAAKPAFSVAGGQAQFMDLAGDGQPDLVVLDGPMPGLYEHDEAEGWQAFRPFTSRLNRDMRDPNLKFVDLDGDGHVDVLITEDSAFVWHPSLAEEGFGPARRVAQALDEEKGPRLVFADGTQCICLADLSGDGLTDLVRIRNGEVCYWPNLGYGRFGAKVTMDNSPLFDNPDQFDHKRIRLADIDGSGTTDIIYLHRDGVRLNFNQSGNSWSAPQILNIFPREDDLVSIVPTDLLGNGTACLVWSSGLPGDACRPMRYVNLMGDKKPHLLVSIKNNLGAETLVEYAPSTKFYLADKLAGNPWITRLPFPVHVVEKVTVKDRWRGTSFSTTYSYHHGYFDGTEREFRGFGRVEQIDVEDYGMFTAGNSASPYITGDQTLYQPPLKTVTWYHTGACFDRRRILSHFEHEYFPRWFMDQRPGVDNVLGGFRENLLPEPELEAEELTTEEWREALRACKGMTLRQEVYELDLDAMVRGKHRPVKLFSTAYHNCLIRRLQHRADNRHAVFLAAESEAITYHYELDLTQDTVRPDPRIAHTLNLKYDEYGNVLQSVVVVYKRLGLFETDNPLAEGLTEDLLLINKVQKEQHLAYTETRYTADFGDRTEDVELVLDNYRLRVPCEVLTYELTGIGPEDQDDIDSTEPRDNLYFTLDELRRFRLSPVHQKSGEFVKEISYHERPNGQIPHKRLVEHVRMLFFKDDEPVLEKPYSLGQLGRLGLPFETYKLALTKELLDAAFKVDSNENLLDRPAEAMGTARQKLGDAGISGYLSGQLLAERFSGADSDRFTRIDTTGQYWIRSGIAGFAPDALQHFCLPECYTDPFGNVTTLEYDDHDLFIKLSTDPMGNKTEVTAFDYRVLAPAEIKDLNDNYSAVAFDVLGLPVASAMMGKDRTESGDSLPNVNSDQTINEVSEFLTQPYDATVPLGWLDASTARFIYDLGEALENGKITYCHRPASACSIMREKHFNQLQGGKKEIQVAVEYSDGMGSVLVKKAQAEPAEGSSELRWIATGKTILNNKGKAVKQYEPYFSETEHLFDPTETERNTGVTPVMYYDAVGRLVRTELPDGSFSRVEISPWHVASYDSNDTVAESQWYSDRGSPDPKNSMPADAETRVAWFAAQHADTPSMTILDSLGREVVAVAHNRIKDPNGIHDFGGETYKDVKYLTFTKLDAEGKPLWIRDARGNLVMQYISPVKANNDPSNDLPYHIDPATGQRIYSVPCYDIAGNLLFQHSLDAGDSWTLNDASWKVMFVWQMNNPTSANGTAVDEEREFYTAYDALHRPKEQWLTINTDTTQLIEHYIYGESVSNVQDARNCNLRGQLWRHFDQSGLKTVVEYDFKGNPKELQRQLASCYKASVIGWQDGSPTAGLEGETFIQMTEYDALNRMKRQFNWHKGVDSHVTVYEPAYNRRGLLESEELVVRAVKKDKKVNVKGYEEDGDTQCTTPIEEIRYNAKGQREYLRLGNGTLSQYDYDPKTFRLKQIQTTRPSNQSGFPQRRSNLADPHIVQQLLYTYDPVGNITDIEDQAYKPVFFDNCIAEPKSLYEYDALYRLISAVGRETAQGGNTAVSKDEPEFCTGFPITDQTLRRYTQYYTYDQVGNINEIRHVANGDGWTRSYEYAADSNRLSSTYIGGDTSSAVHYKHDNHGNMLNIANVAPEQYICWDYRDMIQSLNLIGGGRVYYNYDSGKERTRKVNESQSGIIQWERIYLGGLEIYRKYNGDNVVEEVESFHLVDGDHRLLLVEDVLETDSDRLETGVLYRYQYSNHLGSAVLELDQSAAIISYEEYHPYGTSAYKAVNKDIKAAAKRYRYTGKARDEESGLYYHGARYYAPWLGRWLNVDPAGIEEGYHPFDYANCNPIRLSDKMGTTPVDEVKPKKIEKPPGNVNDLKPHKQQGHRRGNTLRSEHPIPEAQLREDITRVAGDAEYAVKESRKIYQETETLMEEKRVADLKDPADNSATAKLKKKPIIDRVKDILKPSKERWEQAARKARSKTSYAKRTEAHTKQGFEYFRRLVRADTYKRMGDALKMLQGSKSSVTARRTMGIKTHPRGFINIKVPLAIIGIVIAAKEVQKNIREENYSSAAAITGLTALSFTVAAPLVAASGVISKYYTDPTIEQRSFSAGDWVQRHTGSAIAGGLSSATVAVGLSIYETGVDMVHSVRDIFKDW